MDSFSFKPSINSTVRTDITEKVTLLHFYAFERANTSNYTPEIWTDANTNGRWHSIPFTPNNDQTNTTTVWHAEIELKKKQPINYRFTYRLRSNSKQDIVWLGLAGQDGQIRSNPDSENQSIKDLVLLWCNQQSLAQELITDDSIDRHTFTLTTTSATQQQPNANSITYQHPIKLPDQICNSFQFDGLAFVRSKPTWFDPYPFIRLMEISPTIDTQIIIIHDPRENDKKNLLIIIPISTGSSNSTIRSTPQSPLTVCTTANSLPTVKLMILNGPHSKLKYIIDRHLFIINPPSSHHTPHQQERLKKPKKLGYCTWDSLGGNYKLSHVIQVLNSFKQFGIIDLVDRVLLDDGWQDINNHKLLSGWDTKEGWMDVPTLENGPPSSFKAELSDGDRASSSNGYFKKSEDTDLARAIQLIQTVSNRSIRMVGVWVTITGYWFGLDPQSEVMKQFQLQTWSIRPPSLQPSSKSVSGQPSVWMLPKKNYIRPFWIAYFSYLKSAGVQFIKIDNQAGLDQLIKCESDPMEDVEVYKTTLIDIVDDLSREYFSTTTEDDTVINSMAHSPQIWFRERHNSSSELLSNGIDCRTKRVMRTSDDFFPDLSDFSGHQWHIFSNSFNSMLANGLGFTSDFDMTMTKHEYSDYHGSFRVFTTSQIYITDRNGSHDLTSCEKLTCRMKTKAGNLDEFGVVQSMDGVGSVLSSNCLGRFAKDLRLPDSPWGLLKVGLSATYAAGGLIGIWNVKQNYSSSQTAVDIITARDIAETLISNNPSVSSKADPSLENYVIYCDDQHDLSRKRRYKILENFNKYLEINLLSFSSKPIISNVLKQKEYEVWRISKLSNLLLSDHFTEDIISIEVASLGLLKQYVGLCGVMIGTGEPLSMTDPKKTNKSEESNQSTTQDVSLIDTMAVDDDRTSPTIHPNTNGNINQDQPTNGIIYWCLNAMINGLGAGTNHQETKINRKIETRDLFGLILNLFSLKNLKSLFFYFFKSTTNSVETTVDDDLGFSTDSGQNLPSETTPLLDHNHHIKLTPGNIPSSSLSVAERSKKTHLEFHTLFTGQIGFLIRMKFSKVLFNNNNIGVNDTFLIDQFDKFLQIRVDDQIFSSPVNHHGSLFKLEVLNSSSLKNNDVDDLFISVVDFFLIVDLNSTCIKSNNLNYWSISFSIN